MGSGHQGELLPFQGGTNQMVVTDMYSRLDGAAKENLKWYWYTGKDQKTPLNAKDKSRNCHVKLMSGSTISQRAIFHTLAPFSSCSDPLDIAWWFLANCG